MKNFFDKNRYRLSEVEKSVIWQEISLVRAGRRHWRVRLVPTLGAAAVAVCGLVFLFVLYDQGSVGIQPSEPVVAKMKITPPQVDNLGSDSQSPLPAGNMPDHEEAITRQRTVSGAEQPSTDAAPAGPASSNIRGTIYDAATGEHLPYADVLILGVADSLLAAWYGTFAFQDLAPDRQYTLKVQHLGYAEADTTLTLMTGETVNLAFNLEPIIVETLGTFDVAGEDYMVDVTGAKAEQKLSAEKFQSYGIKSVEEALQTQTDVVKRGGELYVRGGRSDEVSMRIDDVPAGKGGQSSAPQPVPEALSVEGQTWGEIKPLEQEGETFNLAREKRSIPSQVWIPPNDQAYDTMYFEHYGINPFIVTEEDALSTFAIDVDNASYTVMRRYLRGGHLPPHDAVRLEEYVNFFDQEYPDVTNGDFVIAVDGSPSPFGKGYYLLRIGVQGRSVAIENRWPAKLVFVIDVSGSMNRESRLELVKRALFILLDELQEGDTVGIVVYGTHGRVVLEPTPIEQRERLVEAIGSLAPGGSTNADAGLQLGYEMARRHYQVGAINRLILCSDGVANQGRTGADSILEHVRKESDLGIGLSTVGFGMGNYNDVLMEKLADRGDGGYYYVDELREAERVFRENLTGTLQTIARDVKIQVEFDPEHVLRYRLLGYENRDVADKDFRNDAVDAGEVGSGHRVTALYEIKLSGASESSLGRDKGRRGKAPHLATVRLRYQKPTHEKDAGVVTEVEKKVTTRDISPSFQGAAVHLQLSAVVAEYAEILRKSYWAKGSRIADLVPMVDHIAATLIEDPTVQEFRQLVRRAADLQGADKGSRQE